MVTDRCYNRSICSGDEWGEKVIIVLSFSKIFLPLISRDKQFLETLIILGFIIYNKERERKRKREEKAQKKLNIFGKFKKDISKRKP